MRNENTDDPPSGATHGLSDIGFSDRDVEALALAEGRRRLDREEQARAVTGPLALVDAIFLEPGDSDIRIADIPATWSFDGNDVIVIADPIDPKVPDAPRLLNHGQPFDGPLSVVDTIEPGGSEFTIDLPVAAPEGNTDAIGPIRITARLARRGGTTAIRVWRNDAPALLGFAGIEGFEFDPRWIVNGRYRTYAPGEDGRDTGYSFAGLDIPYRHEAPGELTFALGGTDYSLPAYATTDSGVFLVVADLTRGVEVDQPMRALDVELANLPGPGESVAVSIDFNQLRLFPCAFSPHFTCPLPGPSNRIEARLTAGERGVRRITEHVDLVQ